MRAAVDDCGPHSVFPELSRSGGKLVPLRTAVIDCGPQSGNCQRSGSLTQAERGIVPVIGVRTAVVDCEPHWVTGWLAFSQRRTVG